MTSPDLWAWIDLETTGLDPDRDSIIEVGCVLTTPNLDEVAEGSWVVSPTDEALGRLMRHDTVRAMHQGNGLLDEVLSPGGARDPELVEGRVIRMLVANGAARGHTVLAGSGVAEFDRRFLARQMPNLAEFFHYQAIDVGSLRRAWTEWTGHAASDANDAKTHRALDDVRCHLAEARAFRALFIAASGVKS